VLRDGHPSLADGLCLTQHLEHPIALRQPIVVGLKTFGFSVLAYA
jgi:hypothetical protein